MENSGMLVEQVVKREHNARYHINKVLIIFATIAIPASLVAIAFITKFPYLNVVAFFVLLFCIYGAWFFITSLEVDFEYAFLSSVFRIDKVIAKRRRRKMVKVDVKSIDDIFRYNDKDMARYRYKKVYNAGAKEFSEDNMVFVYREGEKVLSDFNLRVQAGETIALVGPTGAGKSTVVNLVCRFYEPTAGSIKIDGVDYRQRSQLWLQSSLGYVLQEPRLFSGTIRDNIRYGKLDATDEEIRRAAQLVNAEPFILRMEKGYDTDVGEGGSRLSTGEKQLISFARAILADPRIFVLDEATSSVDTETEVIIQSAIARVLAGRTSFIIAHRLSTVRSADRILVIEDGQIKESGTHQQLLRRRGSYYKLYMSQFEEERAQEILGVS